MGGIEREPGICVVKPTYDLGWTTLDDLTKDQEKSETDKRKAKEKRRGQNKRRKREDLGLGRKEKNVDRLCQNISRDEICPYGENCKYSHDLDAYMLAKPEDVGDSCLFYEKYGSCPYGYKCLFGGKHIVKSKDTGKYALLGKNNSSTFLSVRNELSTDLKLALRKKKYSFTFEDDKKQRKEIDFSDKIFVAPLTTVGNLPFRRIVKEYGADITCGEMAMARNLLDGKPSEWALVRRHECEDIFGVQVADSDPVVIEKCIKLLANEIDVDFFDLNVGCPIELVTDCGAGSALMNRQKKLEEMIKKMINATNGTIPVGVKMRMGWNSNKPIAHRIVSRLQKLKKSLNYGESMAYISIHGRSRQQRYTKMASWPYIEKCCKAAHATAYSLSPGFKPVPILGNGDIMSYTDYYQHMNKLNNWFECLDELDLGDDTVLQELKSRNSVTDPICKLTGVMLARGALIKPWLCTEIKEARHWDISASERFDILKRFVKYGLENWGTDERGVRNTRRYLLEWLSFLHRYVPIGLIEAGYVPQRVNDRPPRFCGRNDLETLLGSTAVSDWIRISEMLLGPVEKDFKFQPKHKANSYATSSSEIMNILGKTN